VSEEQMERLSSESLPRFNGIGDWITTISGVENPVVRDYVVKSYEPGGPFRLCPDGHFLRRVEPAEATRLAMFTGYRPRKSCEWVVCELCGSAWITPNMDYQVCVRCLRLGCECICDSAAEWRKLPDDVRLGNVKHALEAMRISRPGPRALAKEPCWSPEPPKPADPLKHIFGWKGRSELSERRDPGFVYVARAPGRRDNALKIGKARKPENRLKEFRFGRCFAWRPR